MTLADLLASDAYEAGDYDAAFRNQPNPRARSGVPGEPDRFDLTEEEVALYWRGYHENPTGEKQP